MWDNRWYYGRLIVARTESPSVIAEQKSLIEDLAHSNQGYIREFERLKLGIGGPAVEHGDDASNNREAERQSSPSTKSLPGAPTLKHERMNFAKGGALLQDNKNAWGPGSRELTAATKMSPMAQSSIARSAVTPPNSRFNNVFLNTNVQPNIKMPPVQERGIPTTDAPMGFDQEVLFKQLEHYSRLIKNLLKEVDETEYKITFKSRLRVKGGIADLHEGERRELEKMWGCTALHSAEQRLDSLVEGMEDSSEIKKFMAFESSTNDSPYMPFSGGKPRPVGQDVFTGGSDKQPSLSDLTEEETDTHGQSADSALNISHLNDLQSSQVPQLALGVGSRQKRTPARKGSGDQQGRERKEGMRIRRAIRKLIRGAEISDNALGDPLVGSESSSSLTPSLRVSRPVAACQRCRAAKIKCDGKLPACTACEEAMQSAECSMTDEQRPVTSRLADDNGENGSVSPTEHSIKQTSMPSPFKGFHRFKRILDPLGSMESGQTQSSEYIYDKTPSESGSRLPVPQEDPSSPNHPHLSTYDQNIPPSAQTEAKSDAAYDAAVEAADDDGDSEESEDLIMIGIGSLEDVRSRKEVRSLVTYEHEKEHEHREHEHRELEHGELEHGLRPKANLRRQDPDLFSGSEQGDPKLEDMEVVDRLVSLWTTVKPL